MDQAGPERLSESLPLKGLLFRVHRKGDVDRHHESEIDLGLGFGLDRYAQENQ
jgi:hypothetical protein